MSIIVKYLHYDNTDGSVLGYTMQSSIKPLGHYLEDYELPSEIENIEDFNIDYYTVQEVSGSMELVEKTQTEKDEVDADKLALSNTGNRKTETLNLNYDFLETLYKDFTSLPTELQTVLASWKAEMDIIWTNYPE